MQQLQKITFLILAFSFVLSGCQKKSESDSTRYPILMNMVHQNPGEPRFNTKYTEPSYIEELGYNAQAPKFEIQCAETYDDYEDNLVPDNTPEKMWIERKAAFLNTFSAAGKSICRVWGCTSPKHREIITN